jgi:hypothetical protein
MNVFKHSLALSLGGIGESYVASYSLVKEPEVRKALHKCRASY